MSMVKQLLLPLPADATTILLSPKPLLSFRAAGHAITILSPAAHY